MVPIFEARVCLRRNIYSSFTNNAKNTKLWHTRGSVKQCNQFNKSEENTTTLQWGLWTAFGLSVSQSVEGSHWLAQCVGRKTASGLMQSCLHSHYPSSKMFTPRYLCTKASKIVPFAYIGQVWLSVPATRCDVMAFITCNYNPTHTTALMVRVYSSSPTINHTHENFVIPCTVI